MSNFRSNLKIVITNTEESDSESPTTLKTIPVIPIQENISAFEMFHTIKARIQECESQNLLRHTRDSKACLHCILYNQIKLFVSDLESEGEVTGQRNEMKETLSSDQINQITKIYKDLELKFHESNETGPANKDRVCGCGCGQVCLMF